MLRLKKRQEEQKKEAAAAAAAEASASAAAAEGKTDDTPAVAEGKESAEAEEGAKGGQVKIFGIGTGNKSGKKGKRRTPGEIRIQKDIAELEGGRIATIEFPNPNDLTLFIVTVVPDTGYWSGATYPFTFRIPAMYPHEPPKVHCDTKIYHPNIDLQGNVCLNILREDWKPVLDINAVIYGLIYLFYEPNPDDPLNREAAELFRSNIGQFERTVQKTLRGGSYQGEDFPRLL